MAWRHFGGHGQLRCRYRALPPRGARSGDARPGQCRGDPVRGAERGHHLGLGHLSRISRRRRQARLGAQSRLHRAVDPVPSLGHGRSLVGARRNRGGDGAHLRPAWRSRRCRRLRFLHHRAEPASRPSGTAAGLPQRQPRGVEGVLQCAERARQGRDRDRADPDRRADERRRRTAAGDAARRERPAGDVPGAIPARRPPRGLSGNTPARQRPPRRGAADLALGIDPRSQYAQPVLLRRLQVLGPGVRRQVQGGAAPSLCRPGVPQRLPRRIEKRQRVQRRLAAHHRARDAEAGAEAL